MTVEDMCMWVEVPGSIPTEVRRDIIAVLRAGEALYNACAMDNMDEESTKRIDIAMKTWELVVLGGGAAKELRDV